MSNAHVTLALLFVLCGPLPAQAPSPAVRPLAIQKVQDLDYGSIQASPGGGSLVMTADAARLATGSIRPGQGACNPALFRLFGPPNTTFSLQVEPISPFLNPPEGKLRVHDFLCSQQDFQGLFDGTGMAEVRLGGTLDIGTDPKPGRYVETHVRLHLQVPRYKSISEPFKIRVNLQPLLFLTNSESMDFGAWIARGPGMVVLSPFGTCTSSGSNGPLFGGGKPHPAAFMIQALEGTSYTLRFPDSVTLSNPRGNLTLSDFTSDIPSSGTLLESKLSFRVGATLQVGANQAPGKYSGTFEVTVIYQ